MKKQKEVVLAFADPHAPFHHPDTLEFLKAVKKKYQPTQVVCLGDEIDLHSVSFHDHSPDNLSAGEELKEAVAFMKQLYKIFPNVKSCISNHTSLPFRKAYAYGIPKELIKDYKDFLSAPDGWSWADSWIVDGVQYQHGTGYSGLSGHNKAALGNMRSTVIGHLHSNFTITFHANSEKLIFGACIGCLIDDSAYSFEYNKNFVRKPIIGCAIVDGGVPTLIPMLLSKRSRWVGVL